MSDRLSKERKETDALKREAMELGFAIPWNEDWWWTDAENFSGTSEMWELIREDFEYLTPLGKAGATKLIREERRS